MDQEGVNTQDAGMDCLKTEEAEDMDCQSDHPEDKFWHQQQANNVEQKFLPNCDTKNPIEEVDVEQLVEERNSMIKIAYQVCCMYMDIEKSIDSDHESADSGISEQGEERREPQVGPELTTPKRQTRSQSKAEGQRLQAESLRIANSAETMEAFLTLSRNLFQKTILQAVKGTEVGDLLNQLESQQAENERLEQYVLQLERRRDALKLNFAITQNCISQRGVVCHNQ